MYRWRYTCIELYSEPVDLASLVWMGCDASRLIRQSDNTEKHQHTLPYAVCACMGDVISDQPTAGGVLGARDGGGAAQQPLPRAAVRADHG